MPTIPTARRMGNNYNRARNELLEAALGYAVRGWGVIPLHNPTGGGCSCGKPDCTRIGKHPRTAHGVKDASKDPEQIRRWWERWPDANIGIMTGPGSGLLGLDIDGEAGLKSVRRLRDEKCLHKTLLSLTGRIDEDGKRNGWHLLYRYPDGVTIRNSAGLLGKGVDVRGAGGYLVAPPSLHASGRRYQWKDSECAIARAPNRLIARLKSGQTTSDESPMADTLPEGIRNVTLFRVGSALRRKGASQRDILQRLTKVNMRRCRPPLQQEEVDRIAASSWKCATFGPDPLESAWQKVKAEKHRSNYPRFVSLAKHVQQQQPGRPILLPVVRVAQLMGLDRSRMTAFRRRAKSEGVMEEVQEYVPRLWATLFRVVLDSE